MIVVSDTSPLLYLARLGRLDILQTLYLEVLVPDTVWRELTERRPDAPGVPDLLAVTWIRIEPDALTTATTPDLEDIDAGEAAAILLALARDADLVLIDDAAGRRAARQHKLGVRGTLGVFVEARQRGIVPSIAPLVEALLALGFRAHADLVTRVLLAAGEDGR